MTMGKRDACSTVMDFKERGCGSYALEQSGKCTHDRPGAGCMAISSSWFLIIVFRALLRRIFLIGRRAFSRGAEDVKRQTESLRRFEDWSSSVAP